MTVPKTINGNNPDVLEGEILGKKNASDEQSLVKYSDTKHHIFFGVLVIALCIVGAGAWATNVVLDSAFEANGSVVIEGSRKKIQHRFGGIVKELLVKEGQKVREGDNLIVLDYSEAETDLSRLELRLFSSQVRRVRLLGEREGLSKLVFDENLMDSMSKNATFKTILESEVELFEERQQTMKTKIALAIQKAKSVEEEISALTAEIDSHKEHQDIIEPHFINLKSLFAEKIISQNELLVQQEKLTRLYGEISKKTAQRTSRIEHLRGLELERIHIENDLKEEVSGELNKLESEIEDLVLQSEKARIVLQRHWITAPYTGFVQNLIITENRGVVTPGDTLMEIVPIQSSLLVEAQVPPSYRDNLKTNQEAQVLFTAFDLNRTPTIYGKVHSISGDVVMNNSTNHPYYRTLIEVSKEELDKLDGEVINPGMPAQVMISTGEQTLWTYLSKPLVDSMRGALGE